MIDYDIVVTNTGNVTLTDIEVTDPDATIAGSPITIASLVPGASQTLTATYSIVQADLDRGYFTNTATATGKDPDDADVTDSGSATVNAVDAVSYIVLEGFNGQSCTGGGTYPPVEPIPYVTTILEWLKEGTPNFKSVHFTVGFNGVNNEIGYKYTTDIYGTVWEIVQPVIITVDSFTSICMELPLVKSSTYAEAFEIVIYVNGIPTYISFVMEP